MFALRGARRHWLLGLAVCLLTGALGAAVVFAIPAVYESTAKIYVTQNNVLTASLASGRRGEEPSAALRGLREAVLSQDNLLALVREAKLADSWPRTRTWPLRLKDQALAALFGTPRKQDIERALVEMLEASLWVVAEEGTSIRFTVWWRDAESAFRLTQLAQRNFLASRVSDEASSIMRAIALLEEQQKSADQAIEPAIHELSRMREKARITRPGSAPGAASQAHTAATKPAPARVNVPPAVAPSPVNMERLQEIRRAQRDILEPWQRRTAELKFQLTELRATFGPAHPLVMQQQAKVDAQSESPPELTRLKQEETELLENLSREGTVADALPSPSRRPLAAAAPALQRDEDPEVAAARVRVESALAKSRDVSARLDAARMEYATSQASAKYRYAVVEAPEIPLKPFKPKRATLLAAAFAIALALGFLTGAARELSSGRLIEAWQVRRLGVDVLGEIELEDLIKRS
jgi:uncharacterized protein involved in exopolysaccharide biosynthesis